MGAMKPFRFETGKHQDVPYTNAIPPGGYVNARVLAAGVAETMSVPADARIAVFSATADFFARFDGAAAAAPAADINDGTSAELNPTIRSMVGVTQIDMVSTPGGTVTVVFYA